MSNPFADAARPDPIPNMTIAQFCAWSCIGRTAAYEQIKSGKLSAHKIGRRTVITGQAARDWMQSLPMLKQIGPNMSHYSAPGSDL